MNKHRVVSMAIVFAMIAMMLAPGAALASASIERERQHCDRRAWRHR